ncbi:DnaB-like helicase N-terminal domain-containing protein [Streptomyces sp. GbtcB6]|uniref:DnaB-like helicase N-terminal domain-containing protein n=1 Tax=Streptomyces sp. GbtcB6 TaxID=2824751 RepID=UPI001C2F6445|nr:DnaB-like helicase N-terminal domain-containing protein [Streptomyces sp. GbtcB6]
MPPTSAPEEDDELDLSRPPRPVHYAEQALLGALLLEPARLADTSTLSADHFDSYHHATLFTAIASTPPPAPDPQVRDTAWMHTMLEQTRSRTPGPSAALLGETAWLNQVLKRARAQAPGLNPSYLHTLIQVCPRPAHAAAYARMIRTDHARRLLRRHAERLAHTSTDPASPSPAADVLIQADTLGRVLDDLAGQFAPHPGSLPRTPNPPRLPKHVGAEELEEERNLLATATAYPRDVPQMRWLLAEDFIVPLHAALWQCITALVHRGDMVDPITVLGEAQHRGLLTDTLCARDLIALVSTPAASPEHWGEKILQRSLLARAHAVAERITAYTDDPTNTPHQLITGSRRALADLHTLRTRWSRAITPAAEPPSRSPGAPHARPAPPPRAASPPAAVPTPVRTHR